MCVQEEGDKENMGKHAALLSLSKQNSVNSTASSGTLMPTTFGDASDPLAFCFGRALAMIAEAAH